MDGLVGGRVHGGIHALHSLLAGASADGRPSPSRLTSRGPPRFARRVATLGYSHHKRSWGPLRNEQKVAMYHLLFFSKSQGGARHLAWGLAASNQGRSTDGLFP